MTNPSAAPAADDFFRPMGVPNLSVEATPAVEDLRNALTIMSPMRATEEGLAAWRLIQSAIVKLENGVPELAAIPESGGPNLCASCDALFHSQTFDECPKCRRARALEQVARR